MSESEQDLAQAMRDGMRRLASGVCVISSLGANNDRYAMTASSVTSLSDSPASLLVCVHREASIYQAIAAKKTFSVSVLGAYQQDISELCASPEKGESRFSKGQWQLDVDTGLYFLADAQSVFMCDVVEAHGYGTHTIYIGNIKNVELPCVEVEPLIYVDGGYR